jgi:hypothetical protein
MKTSGLHGWSESCEGQRVEEDKEERREAGRPDLKGVG